MPDPIRLVDPASPLFVSGDGPLTDEFLRAAGGAVNVISASLDTPRRLAFAICASRPSKIVILASLRASERVTEAPSEFPLRYLGTAAGPRGVAPLEPGNLITGPVAAILEQALLDGIVAECYLVPREATLDRDVCIELQRAAGFFGLGKPRSKDWMIRAVQLDERMTKAHEPEGFFT